MEVKEGERVAIAKPIASRPACSSFRTFTELLNTSVMVSPESIRHESSLDAAIRPKTVRFRAPGNNGASSTLQSPQGKDNSINKACEETENKNYVVYKPKAKLVSKATVSVLANMLQGNNSQQPWKQQSQAGKNVRQNGRSLTEQESTSSMDGYNWRKYGQKQVKGSECPRSYYKCTHPNCPVKKKVERSIDGQISEIVYQGEHNHSKPPCPLPRRASGKPPVITSHQGTTRQDPNVYYPIWNEPFEFAVPRSANSDSGCKSSQCDEGSNVDVDELSKSKRRRNEKQSSDGGGGGGSETQGSVDSESLEDGFRWRKYGQKVVGGNAYPRSYYRCTSANCRARKHVERASDDPRAFITTYEGKHNHHFLYTPPSSTTTSTLPAFNSPQHSNK